MSIYQIIVIILLSLKLLLNLVGHGRDKEEKYNFWGALASAFIWVLILKGGGFF